MKFFCEYCGYRIDAEKDSKCPNCGASYKKNATFLKMEEEKREEKEKAKQTIEETRKNINNSRKIILIIFIVIFSLSFIMPFLIMGYSCLGLSTAVSNVSQKQVTANINEFATTKTYGFKVTDYEVLENYYVRPREGYETVKFNVQVQNLKKSQLTSENINCIVNGIAQKQKFEDIPMFIDAGLTVEGYVLFEVPKDAKSYDIKYGEYITIHIEK